MPTSLTTSTVLRAAAGAGLALVTLGGLVACGGNDEGSGPVGAGASSTASVSSAPVKQEPIKTAEEAKAALGDLCASDRVSGSTYADLPKPARDSFVTYKCAPNAGDGLNVIVWGWPAEQADLRSVVTQKTGELTDAVHGRNCGVISKDNPWGLFVDPQYVPSLPPAIVEQVKDGYATAVPDNASCGIS